ncbi:testis anion transporter 1 [Platysternon megacephalum]|uniref:Testis anion transporter 1 n=1 Tax=Platysternon megacephalum TaxID=55544 RepID=A0A4D9EDY3_9SAUR|nr:testis anion transporter 1 [Platysternon megacephalum]
MTAPASPTLINVPAMEPGDSPPPPPHKPPKLLPFSQVTPAHPTPLPSSQVVPTSSTPPLQPGDPHTTSPIQLGEPHPHLPLIQVTPHHPTPLPSSQVTPIPTNTLQLMRAACIPSLYSIEWEVTHLGIPCPVF